MLHDVGKIAIPDEILSRRGPLSDEEWAFVRDHTVVGERILRGIPFLQSAASAVRSAHERWDGEGYPDGLARRRDPAAVADRVRLRHLGRDDVRPALPGGADARRGRAPAGRRGGHQLDPQVVSALLAVVGRRDARDRVAA